jgi:heme a synthase
VRPSMLLPWFRRLVFVALLMCAVVVVLGAWVRLTAAGLGCPDWPTCYGHLSAGEALENLDAANAAFPARPLEYGKALREMTHRYAASLLGLVIVVMSAIAFINRREVSQPVKLPALLLLLVVLQGALGMLTVTWLLKPLIVTLHLLGGFATLSLLWWLWLKPDRRELHHSELFLRPLSIVTLLVLIVQILLGGWTSSNYAAVACPDFPTCQGSWWPQMDYRDAFVLWRGLGIDYEGGVLDHPARVAIQFTHRIGATITAFLAGTLVLLVFSRARSRRLVRAGLAVALALAVQIAIGIATVVEGFPLALAAAHNAGAALLLLTMVTLLRCLWPTSSTWLRGERHA